MMRRWTTILLLGLAGAAHGEVVIYRCTDASGAVTIQNDKPCPKGSKQQKRAVAPAAASAPVFAPPLPRSASAPSVAERAPAPEPAPVPPAASKSADDERLPPPALYECRTYDNGRYLSDDGQPPPRCAPLRVTDLGGGGSRVAGSACQMVEDQCQRVPDDALCESWNRRLREAESKLEFGLPEQRRQTQVEVERARRIVRESTCGQ